MIPAKLLRQMTAELTRRTRQQNVLWQRERHDREHYMCQLGQLRVVLRYHPARADADVIELVVLDHAGDPLGQLYEHEGTGSFELLAELLFVIQRAENRNNIRGISDEILRLLPELERREWEESR